jgi:hypothetical protein
MVLGVYADINGFTKIGELDILFDRISYVDLKIPIDAGAGINRSKTTSHRKKQSPLILSYQHFCKQADHAFTLKKLSKGELSYRQFGLTHQLVCEQLNDLCVYPLYLKLNSAQGLKISYHSKKLFWQTSDFRTTIYKTIIGYIIPVAMGALGTFYFIAFTKKQDSRPPQDQQQLPKKNTRSDSTINHNAINT